jgi:hypothetical protein
VNASDQPRLNGGNFVFPSGTATVMIPLELRGPFTAFRAGADGDRRSERAWTSRVGRVSSHPGADFLDAVQAGPVLSAGIGVANLSCR